MDGPLFGPMEIIPAIDLLDGACVRLHQGDYDQVTRFSDDPVAQALSWQRQGAKRLHLVDLDGAKRGEPANDAAVRAIANALDIPVQLGGGVRSIERAEELLNCGLERVILGTVAIEQPDLVQLLAERYPGLWLLGSMPIRERWPREVGLSKVMFWPLISPAASVIRESRRSSQPTSRPMEHWRGPTWTPCVKWHKPAVFL